MFNEILRIKPVLDSGSAKAMEQSLSKRFANVAHRFRSGLLSVIKGTALGISLGLINRLLNPIEALEERIKSLLGQGTDIRDLAERFNTQPGNIKRLQDFGSSVGVAPDKLQDLMLKYAQAVETARKELADPFQQRSEATAAFGVKRPEDLPKDLAEGFFTFLQQLRKEGQGQGRDVFFGDNEKLKAQQRAINGETLSQEDRDKLIKDGLLRHITGPESRHNFEQAIFGEQLFGGQRKLIDTDLPAQLKKLNEPDSQTLTRAVNKTANLADQQDILKTKNDTTNFLNGANTLNSKMIADMEAANAKQELRINKQLTSYDDLRRAADGIELLKEPILKMGEYATKGLGFFGTVTDWFSKPKTARDMPAPSFTKER